MGSDSFRYPFQNFPVIQMTYFVKKIYLSYEIEKNLIYKFFEQLEQYVIKNIGGNYFQRVQSENTQNIYWRAETVEKAKIKKHFLLTFSFSYDTTQYCSYFLSTCTS